MQVEAHSATAGVQTPQVPELQGPFRGPLFKELFGEFPDLDVLETSAPNTSPPSAGLYAHTTEVQSLAQFKELHAVASRQGSVYHHKQYLQHLPD